MMARLSYFISSSILLIIISYKKMKACEYRSKLNFLFYTRCILKINKK